MRRWIGQSFRRELFFWSLLISLLPILLSDILIYQLFQRRVERDYRIRNQQEAKQIAGKLEAGFREISEMIARLSESDGLRSGILSGSPGAESYHVLYEESRKVRDFALVEVYSGERLLCSTESGTREGRLPSYFGFMREALEKPGSPVFCLSYTGVPRKITELLIGEKMEDIPGTVLVRLNDESFSKLLLGSYGRENSILIVNPAWEPVYMDGEKAAELPLLRENLLAGRELMRDVTGRLYREEIGESGLKLFYLTRPPLSGEIRRTMGWILLWIALFSALLSVLASRFFSGYMAAPLARLSAAMRRLRHGDLSVRIRLEREDEFRELSEGFNRTVRKLSDYLSERLSQQKKLNETEIAMMQAQLNPHFLYNTLDSIKWLAKREGAEEIALLSGNLSRILRKSISAPRFYCLSEELELLEEYCEIQELRFEGSFSFEVEVPEELMRARIPKLLLQPIVENAVIHGLDGAKDGMILLRAVREGEELSISVQDDGKGMDPRILQLIERRELQRFTGHLGLLNVDRMLRLHYGERYGIFAKELPEGGSLVTLLLPYQEEREESAASMPEARGNPEGEERGEKDGSGLGSG